MKKATFLLISVAAALLADAPLKTGQVKSYDAHGNEVARCAVKDDGCYQTGRARSYSRSGDVVIDNTTGLEWQDNESVRKQWLSDANCDACRNGNTDACYDTSGDTADTYCKNLTLDGGGWRLPTIEELETLVDDSRYNPSVTENLFQHISSSNYWSSTTLADYTNGAWIVYFRNGYSYYYRKDYSHYVRCVRGGQ